MLIKKCFFAVISITFLALCSVSALEIGVRASPEILFHKVYNIDSPEGELKVSPGVTINGDINLFNFLSVGPQFNFYWITKNYTKTDYDAQLFDLGASVSAFYFPLSRLHLRGGLAGGAYLYSTQIPNPDPANPNPEPQTYYKFWGKVLGEAGFRISPNFTLIGGVSYNIHIMDSDILKQCTPTGNRLGVHLSVQYTFNTEKTDGISVNLAQDEPIFPLFARMYKDNSFGTLTIHNGETAEIRNVRLSFRAGDYTASEMLCGNADIIKKNQSAEIPFFADFSEAVLNFTEQGQIPGEIVVTYELLGAKKTAVKTVIVPSYNRNAIRWTDANALAAFISPSSSEILEMSKYLVGIARDELRSGLNRNQQFAMYLFEGTRLTGVEAVPSADTPYMMYHTDTEKIDAIQHPYQTLSFKSGDYDDVGLLYAALLESVGINTAFIPLQDDFIVLFDLGITDTQAENLFSSLDSLLNLGDTMWIPVSSANFKEGFINSWYKGVEAVNTALNTEESFELILTQDAWTLYPPSGISGSKQLSDKPDSLLVKKEVEKELLRYISTEFGPKISELEDRIRAEGESISAYNSLGLLYVRAGLYDQAISVYTKSAKLKSATAMVNLGNIAILQKDFKTAKTWFSSALAQDPENASAKTGLERVLVELAE